jgi:uncharacterized membrane protein
MKALALPGPAIFGVAMMAFGIENLVYADGVEGLEPLPSWLPGAPAWAIATGLMLIIAGVMILARQRRGAAALAVAVLLGLWLLVLHVPLVIAQPHDGSIWTTTLETLALGCGALVLAVLSSLRSRAGAAADGRASLVRAALVGRVCFGLAAIGFCVLHFLYHAYVASVIPNWLPGHLAWAYLTGLAFLAAGTSAITGRRAQLAMTLTGVMFGTWVLIVHAPRVAAAPTNRAEWTSLIVALAMCGASWIIAEYIALGRAEPSGRLDSASVQHSVTCRSYSDGHVS